MQAGLAFGPAFGVFFGGMLIAAYGWRPFFVGFGLLSLLWIVAWMAVAQRHVIHSDAARASDAPPTALVLREPSLWGLEVSLKEEGVISFQIGRGRENPNVFALWEEYRDEAALDAHLASDHFNSLVINGIRPMAQKRDFAAVVPL
jgi:MFS family permease